MVVPAPIPAGGQHPNKWAHMNNEHGKLAAKKRKHRAKVRTLARKMTTRRLHNAVIAIGFAADYDTGITGNFGVKSLATLRLSVVSAATRASKSAKARCTGR